jgi:ATP-dependent protease Clp ATPase subunit
MSTSDPSPTGSGPDPAPSTADQLPLFDGGATCSSGDGAMPLTALELEARLAYQAIRARLTTAVVGHEAARDLLALLGTQHLLGSQPGPPVRAVLVGPSGSGKSTLTRALAESLRVPFAVVDVTELAETNWSGLQIADVLGELWRQADGDADRFQRAVIVLDELDKVATGAAIGVSLDYAIGRQRSLLPLLGGGALRLAPPGTRDRTVTWDSRHALIVGAGVFDGLPRDRRVTPADLRRLGLMHELVERLGHVIQLAPLRASELASVLRSGLRSTEGLYRRFGFRLQVTDEACALVARAVVEGRLDAGPRQAVTLLAAAAQERLLTLLNAGAPGGSVVALAPDDVALPYRPPRAP